MSEATRALVETVVGIGGREVSLLHPPDAEALLSEEAFEREEFLPYWAELWPSGLALAREVAGRPLAGARVLELGCGLGLPSLAAALGGADVLATDWARDAIALLDRNAERNGIRLETAAVSWTAPAPLVERGPWDLVLAADVLYERRDAEPLLDLLPRLVTRDEAPASPLPSNTVLQARGSRRPGEILLAEPGRPPAAAFLAAARERWQVRTTPLQERPRVDLHAISV
ncbi:MAG TPA: methyltransferase domain-containing protein [Gaiellaceae bacterium]|nr:methyltransferase domain-containing protein [Gaiellaceae bacterium]